MESVYVLIDPKTEEVRYVGISVNVQKRYYQHLVDHTSSGKAIWIQRLKQEGMLPIVKEIEVGLSHELAAEREKYWIQYYFDQGANLTNWTWNPHCQSSPSSSTPAKNPRTASLRLCVRKVAEKYNINRYEIGRVGRLSEPTMEKVWKPEGISVQMDTLDRIAEGMTAVLRERGIQDTITVHDLIEIVQAA